MDCRLADCRVSLETMRLIVDILKYFVVILSVAAIIWLLDPQFFLARCSFFPNILKVVLGCAAAPI